MKTYFNDALIGNSSMLGCLDRKGTLVRLYSPHIDYPQHIEEIKLGIYTPGKNCSTIWLDDNIWNVGMAYCPDTNILKTRYESDTVGFEINCTDFVMPHNNVWVKSLKISNASQQCKDIGVVWFSHFSTHPSNMSGTLFNFEHDCTVSYTPNNYFAIGSDRTVSDFQLGNNPFEAANRSEFYGADDITMIGESVLAWNMEQLAPGQTKTITIFLCYGSNLSQSINCLEHVKNRHRLDRMSLFNETEKFWLDFVDKSKNSNLKSDKLYVRSLLLFKLMSDKQSGGLLASPEIDENLTRCGRYGYCWGRDAGFIALALDMAGYMELTQSFYYWTKKTQAEDGSWYQRYTMDGNLAPCWGLQIDEAGTIIYGIYKHYQALQGVGVFWEIALEHLNQDSSAAIQFLNDMWDTVRKAADFLVNFVDSETGLPGACFDLWEERIGQHTYSCAAVAAGLSAAAKIGEILSVDGVQKWENTAQSIKAAMERLLWDDNKFLRGINTKIEIWGFEGHGGKKETVVNSKGYKRWVSCKDIMVDISLLGVCIPFELFDPLDYKVVKTVQAIEKELQASEFGIKRYQTDNYIGGNPWIVTTVWLALYYKKTGNISKAKEILNWVRGCQTPLGFLPEQVSNGQPAWIMSLTWSHAMYVILYLELFEGDK